MNIRTPGPNRETAARCWRQVRWSVIDVETTGLDFDNDDIISVGVASVADGVIDASSNFYTLVRPTAIVSATSATLHGLTRTELEGAPTAREGAAAVADHLADSIVIAHAAWVERAFLDKLSWETGHSLPTPLVDTAALSRALGVDDTPDGYEPPLELLAQRLGLPVYTPHHALGDALTTAVLFLALVARLEAAQSNEPTVKQLIDLSNRYRA